MAEDIHLLVEIFPHGRLIDSDHAVAVLFDAVTGHFRRVKGMSDLFLRCVRLDAVDARFHLNAGVVDVPIDLIAYLLELRLQVVSGQQSDETVGRQMADKRSGERVGDRFCGFLETQISPVRAVDPVVFPETGDIEDHRAKRAQRSIGLPLRHAFESLFVEIMHARQIRRAVSLPILRDLLR